MPSAVFQATVVVVIDAHESVTVKLAWLVWPALPSFRLTLETDTVGVVEGGVRLASALFQVLS